MAALVIAGTGHRPEKLGGYGWKVHSKLFGFAKGVLTAMCHNMGETKIITGMALGWDMALADAALALKIPYIAAVPFTGQESKWSPLLQTHYRRLLESAEKVEVVCRGPYSVWKMEERNQWMVDNCTRVLALWDGSKGGTYNCIQYAKMVDVPIDNVWDQWEHLARLENISLGHKEA